MTIVPFAMMAFLVTMANVMISAVKVNSALRASALNAARCAALALRRPICAIPVLKMVTYLHLPNCFSTKDFVPRLALLAQLILAAFASHAAKSATHAVSVLINAQVASNLR